MTDLTLIRAGHTKVADGQCGLCDVPWPCDVGVVLAAQSDEFRRRSSKGVLLDTAFSSIEWTVADTRALHAALTEGQTSE